MIADRQTHTARHTHKHTNRHAHHNTPLPYWGRKKYKQKTQNVKKSKILRSVLQDKRMFRNVMLLFPCSIDVKNVFYVFYCGHVFTF